MSPYIECDRIIQMMGYDPERVKVGDRTEPLPKVRQIVSFVMIRKGHRYLDAALALGYKDHSTIIHNVKMVNDLYLDEAMTTLRRWNEIR